MIFLPVIIFVLGTIIGSFLNVVIYRLNTGRSIVTGRSKCATCNRVLHWHELVPVWSFIFLRGKCRTCKTEISFQYPLVEIITGILFVVLYNHILLTTGFTLFGLLQFVFVAVILSLALVIVVYDIYHKIIPEQPMRTALLLSFILVFAKWFINNSFNVGTAFVAGPLVALPFFLLWALSKGKWMGFGDVKIALVLGWLLGLAGGLLSLLVSFWIGGLFGIILLIASKKYSMKTQIPFAPFLILGALIVYFSSLSISMLFPLW